MIAFNWVHVVQLSEFRGWNTFHLKLDGMVVDKRQSTKTNGNVGRKWEETTICCKLARALPNKIGSYVLGYLGYERLPRLIETNHEMEWNYSEVRLIVYSTVLLKMNYIFLEYVHFTISYKFVKPMYLPFSFLKRGVSTHWNKNKNPWLFTDCKAIFTDPAR